MQSHGKLNIVIVLTNSANNSIRHLVQPFSESSMHTIIISVKLAQNHSSLNKHVYDGGCLLKIMRIRRLSNGKR